MTPKKAVNAILRYRFVLVEAFALVVFAWLLNMAPMRVYTRVLGVREAVNSKEVSQPQLRRAVKVTRAIHALAKRMPFKAVCIEETIAASIALRWRGIPSTSYIGVHKDREKREPDAYGHNAHAWVKVGDHVLIGGPNVSGYVPLVSFA